MDTITHGLSGALASRVFKEKNVNPKALLIIGFLAGIFPDFDFLMGLISPDFYLLNHRGLTHSIFLLPIWGALVSLFCAWLFANKIFFKNGWVKDNVNTRELTKEMWLLSMVAILLHIVGDVVTQFGTMFLFPFSSHRFEIGNIFIIDLRFSGILLLSLALSLLIPKHKKLIAYLGLLLWFSYMGYTYMLKKEAEQIARDYAQRNHIENIEIFSSPRAVNPYNWTVILLDKNKERYHYIDFSLDSKKVIQFNYKDQSFIQLLNNNFPPYSQAMWSEVNKWGKDKEEEELAHRIWSEALFQPYVNFYLIPAFDFSTKGKNETCGFFRDLRFPGTGRENGTPMVYGMCFNSEKNTQELFQFVNREKKKIK